MKTSGLFICLLIIAQSIFLCGCSNKNDEIDEQVENLESFKTHVTEFGVNIFKSASQSFSDCNLVISPISAQLTLSMAANVLNSSEICKAFGYEDLNALNIANKHAISKLATPAIVSENGDTFSLATKISNAVWFGNNVNVKAKKILNRYYEAKVNQGNLNSPKERKAIESWLSEAVVDNEIRPTIPDTENVDIMINSVLYFNKEWDSDYHFSESYKDNFLTLQGERMADFMFARINANYFTNEEAQCIILGIPPYKMVCVMPTTQSLSKFINNFGASNLIEIINESTERSIDLSFPLFELNTNISLIPLLKNIGLNLKSTADDTNGALPNLNVDQISTIRVDQTGVAAGSVTSLWIVLGLAETNDIIKLTFNHPFIYFIIEPETQAILMAGQYTGPEE